MKLTNFFLRHLWPILLTFIIALNEVLNCDASPWWLVIASAGGWVLWQWGVGREEEGDVERDNRV